jgi:hypothetical protein
MPVERRPPAKPKRLPFNPPRPRASPSAGPSTASGSDANKTTKKRANTNPKKTSSASSKPRKSTSSTQRQSSAAPRSSSPSESESSPRRDDEEAPERDEHRNLVEGEEDEPDYVLAEITTNDKDNAEDVHSSAPAIPPKLLTRLLTHHFQDPKTKLAKDADGAVAKYVDVFVREALARAAYERSGTGREGRGGGGGGVSDGFLEVEDLEKMAPQLVLDF